MFIEPTVEEHIWGQYQREVILARSQRSQSASDPDVPGLTLEQIGLVDGLPGKFLARAMLNSLLLGDTQLAEQLWLRRGPIKVEIIKDDGHKLIEPGGAYSIDWMQNTNLFSMIEGGSQELGQLYKLIELTGADGLIGKNGAPTFLYGTSLQHAVQRFHGQEPADRLAEIPELSSGVVSRAATLLAWDEQWFARHPGTDGFLCWADRAMVEAFPDDLRPFTRYSDVIYAERQGNEVSPTAESPRKRIDMLDFSAAMAHQCDPSWMGRLGVAIDDHPWERSLLLMSLELGIKPDGWEATHVDHSILATFLPKAQKHGLAWPAGKVLCMTTTGFLNGFPVQAPNPIALNHSREAVSDLVPLDRMSIGAGGEIAAFLFDTFRRASGCYGRSLRCPDLVRNCGDDAFGLTMRRELPKPLTDVVIRGIRRSCSDFFLMMNAIKYFGVQTDETKLHLEASSASMLGTDGFGKPTFRLAPGTQLTIDPETSEVGEADPYHKAIFKALAAADGTITINGIPTDCPPLEVLSGCLLKKRPTEAIIYRAIARSRGLGPFVPHLKKVSDWRNALKVFPAGDFEPYSALVPNQLITSVAAGILEI